jgi:hypothetical protein
LFRLALARHLQRVEIVSRQAAIDQFNKLLSAQADLPRHFSNQRIANVVSRGTMAKHGSSRGKAPSKVLIQKMDVLSPLVEPKALSLKPLSNFAML